MTIPVLASLGMAAVLAACSSSSARDEEPSRANDPMAKLNPGQVYMEKGVHYMEEGRYDVALKDLTRSVELDDDNSDAYNALGVLYQKLDDPAHADASFKRALSIKPDNFAARNNYGRFLCSQNQPAEAFAQFQQVIATKLYNQPWIPLTNAGVCANSTGRKTDAEAYLRQALEVEPDFPPALLEMAKLSRDTRQYLSARGFLQRYFSVAGPSPESLQLGIEIETALGNGQAAGEYSQAMRRIRTLPSRSTTSTTGGSPADH
jgi:type IV pilus assembly protein PilF